MSIRTAINIGNPIYLNITDMAATIHKIRGRICTILGSLVHLGTFLLVTSSSLLEYVRSVMWNNVFKLPTRASMPTFSKIGFISQNRVFQNDLKNRLCISK